MNYLLRFPSGRFLTLDGAGPKTKAIRFTLDAALAKKQELGGSPQIIHAI